MYFKLKSKNPYQNLYSNVIKIYDSNKTMKSDDYIDLIKKLYSKLDFSKPNKWLYKHPSEKFLGEGSYSTKINPWIIFVNEIKLAIKDKNCYAIGLAIYNINKEFRKEDWLKYE